MAAAEAECLPVSHVDLRDLFERKSRSAWSALSQDAESRRIWDAFVDLDDDTQAGLLRADHSVALHRVNRRLRFLIKERADFVTPLVKRVEDAVVNLSPGHRVVLHMPLPVERLVAHGVAQFHHMGHRSFGVGKDRITVIHARRRVGPARLLDLLV